MILKYKTKTETGQIEITHRDDVSMEPWNITLKGKIIEKVSLITRDGNLYISAKAWKLIPVFIQLKDVNKSAEINIQVMDMDNNPVKAPNLLNIRSNAEFTLENLAYRPKNNEKLRYSTAKGNYGTGCDTTWSKAMKYGYDSIER